MDSCSFTDKTPLKKYFYPCVISEKNETKRNEINEIKRNQRKQNEINENKTK
jgi:hypothetical protein